MGHLTCRQCGSTALTNLGRIPLGRAFAGRDLSPPWAGGTLFRCRSCYLGFRHPIRPEREYEQLYEAASNGVWVSDNLRPDQLRVRDLINRAFRSGKVLDVGCYDGALLQSLGANFEKFGIEASSAAARVARTKGIEIVASNFREVAAVDAQFDVVCCVDVIEHVAAPSLLVQQLSRGLAPGGLLIISTGDLDTPAWRYAGGRYWYCSIPEHVSFISRAWAEAIGRSLDLHLLVSERFSYGGVDESLLSHGRRQFFRDVTISKLKMSLISIFPERLKQLAPNFSYGQAGLFSDHSIFAFATRADKPMPPPSIPEE